MNTLTYKSGPLGGDFYINGELFSTDDRPLARLIAGSDQHTAVYQYRYGNDGDKYWTKLHIGYYENMYTQRFVSVADLPDSNINIEIEFIK